MVEKEAHSTSEVEVDFNFDARLFATDEILTTTLKGIVETIRNESNGGGKKRRYHRNCYAVTIR